jgi:hypothetical protein
MRVQKYMNNVIQPPFYAFFYCILVRKIFFSQKNLHNSKIACTFALAIQK